MGREMVSHHSHLGLWNGWGDKTKRTWPRKIGVGKTDSGSCLNVLMAGGGILPDKWPRREPTGSLSVFFDSPWRPPSTMFVTP